MDSTGSGHPETPPVTATETIPRHIVGVAAVVLEEGGERALTIRRRDDARWELPGGRLEVGEAVLDGLRREVLEETGLRVEPLHLTGVYQNLRLGPIALIFACRVVGGELRTTAESTGWQWLTAAEFDEVMAPAWAVRFRDALEPRSAVQGGRPTVPVREHDGTNVLRSLPS